jgi:hypothetical protein
LWRVVGGGGGEEGGQRVSSFIQYLALQGVYGELELPEEVQS